MGHALMEFVDRAWIYSFPVAAGDAVIRRLRALDVAARGWPRQGQRAWLLGGAVPWPPVVPNLRDFAWPPISRSPKRRPNAWSSCGPSAAGNVIVMAAPFQFAADVVSEPVHGGIVRNIVEVARSAAVPEGQCPVQPAGGVERPVQTALASTRHRQRAPADGKP